MYHQSLRSKKFQLKSSITILSILLLLIFVLKYDNNNDLLVNAAWNGCVNIGLPTNQQNTVAIDQQTIVCLSIGNRINWSTGAQYVVLNFSPTADQYSRFHIPNSYRDLVQNSDSSSTVFSRRNITVMASSSTEVSYLKLYYDMTDKKIYPFLTAIINVQRGKITGITWDNACVFCGGFTQTCEENTYNFNGVQQTDATAGQDTKSCYFTKEQCEEMIKAQPNSTDCDITLYTVWSGTDYNNNAFQSLQYRFSAFPPQQITDRVTQLLNPMGLTASDLTPDILEGDKNDTKANNTNRRAIEAKHYSL